MVKVSVIIPIYNVELYIEECLKSVIGQTLEEIEIICVNDGTIDSSMDIVQNYANKDNRIRIVNKENGGLSSARNAGIEVANGKYIYFLDSDDYIKNNALEILYTIANENDLDNLFFSAECFFESDEIREKNSHYLTYYKRNKKYTGVYTGEEIFIEMEKNGDIKPSACLQITRLDILKANMIRFYEGILHEDNLYTFQLLTLCKRVMCIEDELYLRRVRDESIMTSKGGFASSYGYYTVINEFLEFLKKDDIGLDYKKSIVHRLNGCYGNAIDKVRNVSDEEIFEYVQGMPIEEQIKYMIYVKYASNLKRNERNRNRELQEKLSEQSRKIKVLSEELREQKRQAKEKNKLLQKSNLSMEQLKNENDDIRNSITYKIGSIILYLPKKIRDLMKIRNK